MHLPSEEPIVVSSRPEHEFFFPARAFGAIIVRTLILVEAQPGEH
jgi:hypothetical protein